VGVEPGLDADRYAEPVVAVREVGHIADALQLLGLYRIADLLDQSLGTDHVRQLRHDDAGSARPEGFDRDLAPHLERTASVRVRVLDTVETHQDAAGGEVGPRHELHELFGRGVGVLEQVRGRGDDLDQVVRRHVGGHADGDATRTVDEEIGERGREHGGLLELAVVVRDEVDDVLVEVLGERHRRRGQARLRVTRRRRAVVE